MSATDIGACINSRKKNKCLDISIIVHIVIVLHIEVIKGLNLICCIGGGFLVQLTSIFSMLWLTLSELLKNQDKTPTKTTLF